MRVRACSQIASVVKYVFYVFLSKKKKYALYVLKEYVFYVFLSKKKKYVLYVFLSKREKYALYVLKEYVFYVFLSKKEEYVLYVFLSKKENLSLCYSVFFVCSSVLTSDNKPRLRIDSFERRPMSGRISLKTEQNYKILIINLLYCFLSFSTHETP